MTVLANKNDLILVAGGGGSIGGHLVAEFRRQGFTNLRSVDRKSPEDWDQVFSDVDNRRLDLRHLEACREAARDAVLIYNVAADMGGMG